MIELDFVRNGSIELYPRQYAAGPLVSGSHPPAVRTSATMREAAKFGGADAFLDHRDGDSCHTRIYGPSVANKLTTC